jgi:hypothetical protein
VIGAVVGLAGRPLLLLAIIPGSFGAVFFCVMTTLPWAGTYFSENPVSQDLAPLYTKSQARLR